MFNQRQLLFAALLLAVPRPGDTIAIACLSHADCATSSEPLGFCAPPHGRCVSLSAPVHESSGSSGWFKSNAMLDSTRQSALQPQAPTLALSDIVNATNAVPLTTAEKLSAIRVARKLLIGLNPNQRLYSAVHHARPLRDLDTLAGRVRHENMSNLAFHAALRAIHASWNDRHTTYLPPPPLRTAVATLGLSLRLYHARNSTGARVARVVVSDMVPYLGAALPPVGSDILSIDGVPALAALRRAGRAGYGANAGARLARGLDAFVFRLLALEPLPLASRVCIRFRAPDGSVGVTHASWLFARVTDPVQLAYISVSPGTVPAPTEGEELLSDDLTLSSRDAVLPDGFSQTRIPVAAPLAPLLQASVVRTPRGTLGVLRLPFFVSPPTPPYVAELRRVLARMPRSGLLLDLRGNPGGSPAAARVVYELVTGRVAPALRASVRATGLFARLVERNITDPVAGPVLAGMRAAVRAAVRVGEEFTGPTVDLLDLTAPPGLARPIGRAYVGPVATVVDARTYSAAEVCAVLLADGGGSTVIGVDGAATGGGGAAMLPYSALRGLAPDLFADALPAGVEMTTAFARFFRLGRGAGGLVEAFGVAPDVRYHATKRDALQGDADLLMFVARTIARQVLANVTST